MNPVARASIFSPAGTVGACPGLQPVALGTRIGGRRYWCGAGSCGLEPYWVLGGAGVPLSHAVSAAAAPSVAAASRLLLITDDLLLRRAPAAEQPWPGHRPSPPQ